MGLELQREVGAEEAVTHWYDEVYLPIVQAIRQHNLLSEFPGQTETELYLAIIAYLDRLRRTNGNVSVEEAAIDYAEQFKQHPIKKILGGLLAFFANAEPAPTQPETTAPVAVSSTTKNDPSTSGT